MTSQLRRQVVEFYAPGNKSALQTAEEFDIGKSTVLRILKQEGVVVRKHGQRLT